MNKQGNNMYLIIDNTNQAIHREPNKKSYASTQYKTVGAAKAGITRTVKYYQKAYDQVAEALEEGKADYTAPMYNAYRDATESQFNLTHKQFASSYTIVAVEDYVEPMITKTGICPGTGKQITVTEGINTPHYMSTLSESYWSA